MFAPPKRNGLPASSETASRRASRTSPTNLAVLAPPRRMAADESGGREEAGRQRARAYGHHQARCVHGVARESSGGGSATVAIVACSPRLAGVRRSGAEAAGVAFDDRAAGGSCITTGAYRLTLEQAEREDPRPRRPGERDGSSSRNDEPLPLGRARVPRHLLRRRLLVRAARRRGASRIAGIRRRRR